MKKTLLAWSAIFWLGSGLALAQELHYSLPDREVIIPESSIERPNHATTGIIVTKPKEKLSNGLPHGETPASMACIYGFTPQVPGCPIEGTTILPTSGWGAIALVDAYNDPTADSDLAVFSAQFGLPACTTANGCFHKIHVGGSTPPDGWQDEQSLDIEWSHAMAPNAQIYLVEAASDSITDLMAAELEASALVSAAGGGNVSNSWSVPEQANEASYDSNFQTPGIIYTASSGDYSAPARYPSSSPYIVSAGGTSLVRDANGNFTGETGWSTDPSDPPGQKSGGSGGPSLYEARPLFQNVVQKITGNMRGTPDISFDADPKSGVLVYSTFHGGWLVDGGTSVSSPALAGVINSANHRMDSSQEELAYIYGNYVKNYHQYWHDIVSGYNGYPALVGYDFVTGLGSPLGYLGK